MKKALRGGRNGLSVKSLSSLALFILNGCAIYGGTVSEVVPLGSDTYMISAGGHEIISTPSSVRMKAIKEASKFCATQGKEFLIDSFVNSSAGPWIDYESDVQFKCLDKSDTDLTRPILRLAADITIDNK